MTDRERRFLDDCTWVQSMRSLLKLEVSPPDRSLSEQWDTAEPPTQAQATHVLVLLPPLIHLDTSTHVN